MSVTQVVPVGAAFQGFPWADQVTFTVRDNNNDPVNLTDSTWEVLSEQVTVFDLTTDLSQAASGIVTATVSLTTVNLAGLSLRSFRWYLGETTVLNAALLWRRVDVSGPS